MGSLLKRDTSPVVIAVVLVLVAALLVVWYVRAAGPAHSQEEVDKVISQGVFRGKGAPNAAAGGSLQRP